ncbi:Establishment of cohesion 1 [Globodera pallida]|nr:Establishment of cohesion 1 [Globodera pallida]
MQSSLRDFFLSPRASSIITSNKSKSTPRRRPRLKLIGNPNNRPPLQQMIIDAGQKKIGLEQCAKCGMVYSLSDPNDVEQHGQFHHRFTQTKSFQVTVNQLCAWKQTLFNEYVESPLVGYLFLIDSLSTSTLRRKMETILTNIVNEELGYSSDLPVWDLERQRKALVFVRDSNGSEAPFVCGILLVDIVAEAMLMPQQKRFKGSFLGIDRIWVHSRLRRKGLANFLLDSSRRILAISADKEMPRTRVAFSDPSGLGVQLAINYVGDKENGRYITCSSTVKEDKLGVFEKELGV